METRPSRALDAIEAVSREHGGIGELRPQTSWAVPVAEPLETQGSIMHVQAPAEDNRAPVHVRDWGRALDLMGLKKELCETMQPIQHPPLSGPHGALRGGPCNMAQL